MPHLSDIRRSLLAFFATEKRRRPFRHTIADHAPDYYIAALRPADCVTEFGD
jgi:hypothetical protein